MSLRNSIRFQKTLAVFAGASNEHEVAAAELAARRIMESCNIDPVDFPTGSLYGCMGFADNALLKKLREEWREAHPDYWYGKADKSGTAKRLRHKPRPKQARPRWPGVHFEVNTTRLADFMQSAGLGEPETDVRRETSEGAE
jgi:hypothetical protein